MEAGLVLDPGTAVSEIFYRIPIQILFMRLSIEEYGFDRRSYHHVYIPGIFYSEVFAFLRSVLSLSGPFLPWA